MNDQIAVELREVSKRFGDVVAVDPVSLQIHDGEFFVRLQEVVKGSCSHRAGTLKQA